MSYPSFRTVSLSCLECGATTRRAYHSRGECDGLWVEVDGTVQCVGCDMEFPFSASVSCPNCGGQTEIDSEPAVPVVRPRISIQRIESALAERIIQGYSAPLQTDQTLSAIAREDATLAVEADIDADTNKTRSLDDRLDQYLADSEVGAWRVFSVSIDGQTPERIAAKTYDQYLSEWPEEEKIQSPWDGTQWTHLGVGTQWTPVNKLYVCCIVKMELVQLPSDVAPGRLEKSIHKGTQQRRLDNGCDPLAYDERLADIALNYSREQAVRGSIDHFEPDGADVGTRYQNADYDFTKAGENLFQLTVPVGTETEKIAEAIVNGWMDSTDHRANILNDDFDREGIGVYQSDNSHIFVTQNFS